MSGPLRRRAAALVVACVAVAACAIAAVAAPAEPVFPEPSARVVDAAGLLSPATRDHLEAVCAELDEKTGAQLAVALVPSIAPLDIEAYSVRLFERWGVGRKDRDDGALFVVARDERKVRIEVGYGLEGLLPDGRVGGILRGEVVPHLRRDDWDAGVTGAVETLAAIVAADHGDTLATLGGSARGGGEGDGRTARGKRRVPWILVILAVIIAVSLISRGGGPMGPGGRRRMYRRGIYWGGMGGGFGGGGFGGGGFGGFGGGASGGGGASSSF